MQPVMITAAMVGAEVTKAQQSYLPPAPQEIIQAAIECSEAGAAIIHIHVRDAEGNAFLSTILGILVLRTLWILRILWVLRVLRVLLISHLPELIHLS